MAAGDTGFPGWLDAARGDFGQREEQGSRLEERLHLPRDLHRLVQGAPDRLDPLMRIVLRRLNPMDALGEHIGRQYLEAKRTEWREYIMQVSQWELENYLAKY